jgi:ferredoxin
LLCLLFFDTPALTTVPVPMVERGRLALLQGVPIATERVPYSSATEYTNCSGNRACAIRVDGAASEPTTRRRAQWAASFHRSDARLLCQTRVRTV